MMWILSLKTFEKFKQICISLFWVKTDPNSLRDRFVCVVFRMFYFNIMFLLLLLLLVCQVKLNENGNLGN